MFIMGKMNKNLTWGIEGWAIGFILLLGIGSLTGNSKRFVILLALIFWVAGTGSIITYFRKK